jgi:hypothetical protein
MDFDISAFFAALDAQRLSRGLSWSGVAEEMWDQSSVLNAVRDDHPISASTITGMTKLMDTSCQHALFMLRWLGMPPENFVPGLASNVDRYRLPEAGRDRRLRWDLRKLYAALDAQRQDRQMTWPQLARELGCTNSQLTGIKRARFTMSMRLAMRIVAWLDRPARDFIRATIW